MTSKEYENVWADFERKFEFNPSINSDKWPSIKEPRPSATFLFDNYVRDSEVVIDPDELFISVFQKLSYGYEMKYFLDWQHECYVIDSFVPKDYYLGVFPDGDYHIWLSEGLESGIFGHPWEKSICIFGGNLIELAMPQLIGIFGRPIRENL